MALVGFTPTITRAGIMLLVYYSLRILAHTSDSLTSLSLSVFLIVLINPCSIYDISLWLSAFATLGIVALSEIYNDKKIYHILLRPIHYFVNSIISSFFAITLTLFLTVKSFNTFSPVSLISTAIFSPIIDLYIYFGMLMPVLGWLIPLDKIAIPLTNFIKLLAEKMSSPWWVVARADNLSIKLLTVLISIIFVCFFIFDIKRKRPFIIASVGVMLATIILSTVLSANAIYKNRSVYTSNSTYDNVLITGNGTTTFIISENVTVRNMYYISDIASKNGICTINNLVFTCYSDKFNSLDRLINYVKTNTIYVPVPQNSIEIEKAKYLSNLLSAYGTTLRFYKIEETLSFSEVEFNLVYYSPAVDNRSFSCIYTLKKSDKTITYFSEQSHSIAPDTVLFDSEKSDEWILGVGSGRSDPYDIYLNTPNNIIVGRGGRIAPEIESEMLNDGVNITYTDNFTILFQ
jgi:competence protein ComEC